MLHTSACRKEVRLDREQPRWWQQTSLKRVVWIIAVEVLLVVLVVFVFAGYRLEWQWTGFPSKKLFDWVQILVIPVAVSIGTFALNRAAKRRDDDAQQAQKQRAEALETRQEEEASLRAYLDYVSGLLTDPDRPLRRSHQGDNLSIVARAQTLTALGRLEDGRRKASVLRFLYEAGLIKGSRPIIELTGADLRKADLSKTFLAEAALFNTDLEGAVFFAAILTGIDLQGADLFRAILSQADLPGANLVAADLSESLILYTDLSGATLFQASLRKANLIGANLSNANLSRADLRGADLSSADLSGADLREAVLSKKLFPQVPLPEADLSRANLSGASLTDAVVTEEQLNTALSLEGATMPDGQTLKGPVTPEGPMLEDWLKSQSARRTSKFGPGGRENAGA